MTTTTRTGTKKLAPVHPGQVLALDFLDPLGISMYRLAKETGISQQHFGRIVKGSRGITADVALRLARYFGTSAKLWMNLQAQYDLDVAEDTTGRTIEKRVRHYKAA
ncbi:MAG: HigA family addiction module antidote protein [Planctomycetes bacterium]|nr:HigA family addiction module antidote protein [Planctomycetota bacterium]